MVRPLAVAASAVVLAVAAVVATARGGASYTLEEVVEAFEQHRYTLVEPPRRPQ